jgi:predicted enzyme related to lactoylglutathione lyase
MDIAKDTTIQRMSPQLLVTDLDVAVNFYTGQLGFGLDFRYEDFYAGIVKDGHTIHLKLGTPTVKDSDNLDIVFAVANIETLYKELCSKGLTITQKLRQMPYGREFYIADPYGHILSFMET